MQKAIFILAVIVSFSSCQKKCGEREFPSEVCIENGDTTLGYHLIVGKWYLRRDFAGQPGPGGISDNSFTCYAHGPEPIFEFLPDRTVIINSKDSSSVTRYSLLIDTSGSFHGLILHYTLGNNGGARIGLCDNQLSFDGSGPGYFWSKDYCKW